MAESPADTPADGVVDLEDASVYTIDELNDDIATVVETADGLTFDYVVGDVSGYNESNGHLHFDLDHNGASLHCLVYASRRTETTDALEEGMQIAVAGDLSFFEPRGECSVIVRDVVELGDGVYQQTYRENRRMLEENDLLDDEYKAALPPYPQTIGIVTSADSDAREDAVTSIHDQHPDVDIVVRDATVQGENALPTLLEGITALDNDPDVDLIVVTRGGGADTTLRVFNDVSLCRVIFDTDTPIVVGIGHEQDEPLAGEVADEHVMTPTDVGSTVPAKADVLEDVDTVAEFLDDAYERIAEQRLRNSEESLDDAYTTHVTSTLDSVDNHLDHAFETLARERLTELDNQLDFALDALEQEAEHEREKAQATKEIEAKYARRQRVQRAVIAVLVTALLGVAVYVFFFM